VQSTTQLRLLSTADPDRYVAGARGHSLQLQDIAGPRSVGDPDSIRAGWRDAAAENPFKRRTCPWPLTVASRTASCLQRRLRQSTLRNVQHGSGRYIAGADTPSVDNRRP